jgi:ribose transport system ATP-binding protein
VLREFDVRPPEARKTYRQLSGGNQQKALIARWVQANPAIFLMHEPTQGVDIGARNDIFKLIRRVAAQGASFLCASSDYEQLAAICDRVLIFSRGRVSCELGGIHVEKAEIMAKVYESVTADGEAGEAWG